MNPKTYRSAKNKKEFDWKDITLLLWFLPLVGYLFSICFDIGYISYFDLPPSFAEVNWYTVGSSALGLVTVAIIAAFIIAITMAVQQVKCDIVAFFADTNSAIMTIIVFFNLKSAGAPVYWAPFIYLGFLVIARGYWLFVRSEVAYSIRIRQNWFNSSDNETTAKSDKSETTLSYKIIFAAYLVIAVIALTNLIMLSGRVAASTGLLEDKSELQEGDQFRSILLPRNDNRFVKISYEKKTGILSSEFQVVSLSEKPIKLVKVKDPTFLMSKTAYDKRQDDEKITLEIAKALILAIRGY